MYKEIEKYFSRLYFPAIAKKVIPVLIYSAISQKFQKYEVKNHVRYRLNIMLQWKHGYFKSTILEQMAKLFPFEANLLTTSSAAAIRGSFIDGKFYPPELLVSDLMIFPEFTAILDADRDVAGQILSAAEEANIRIALVKTGKITPKVIEDVESYGAKVVNKRLIYRNPATIWTATHTIDTLSEANRDALLSRFYLVQIKNTDITYDVGWKDAKKFVDVKFEKKIATWFEDIYGEDTEPDHEFANKVLDLMKSKYIKINKTPREVGDIRRMIFAHHEIFPDDEIKDVVHVMRNFMVEQVGRTTRDIIIDLIHLNPMTSKDIMINTGLKKSTIFNHLKRTSALSTGSNPRRYYLESLPKKIYHGGQRDNAGKKPRKIKTITQKATKKITKKKSSKKSKKSKNIK